jgi:hypothetical protein
MRRLLLCFATLSLSVLGCNITGDDTDSSAQSATARGKVCSDPDRKAAAERMIHEPIKPPRILAGIDLAGGDAWPGLDINDAANVLCQADDVGADDTTTTVAWGSAIGMPGAFTATYNTQTRHIESYQLGDGYKGTLDFKSRPGTATSPNPFGDHTYSIGVGTTVLRDGQPYELLWSGAGWERQATELYDALMYTFAPEQQGDQQSCIASATCLARAFATGDGVFGVRPLGIYLYVQDVHAKQPAASTPSYLYGFYVKMMPFSRPETFLKLDDEGPIAETAGIGINHSNCTMKLGQSFKNFVDTCVSVLGDAAGNEFQKQKLLGGAHINPAGNTWILEIEGVVPSFTVTAPSEGAPALASTANGLTLDVRAAGKQRNEYSRDGQTMTLGATAAVYREYARLVQNALHAALPADLPKFAIGAAECLSEQPAHGCTGMESFITPAMPDTGDAGIDKVSVGPGPAMSFGIRSAIKASTLMAAFCTDPGTFEHCYGNGDGGATGALFPTTADRVTAILGGATPEAAKKPDFYVPLFAKAVVKYLRAAALYPTDLSKPEYSALEPADGDIVVQADADPQSDRRVIQYKTAFQTELLMTSSLILNLKFSK